MTSEMSWNEARYAVEGALPDILAKLIRPAPTSIIAERVARETDIGTDQVAKHLLKLAPTHPNATHNGVVKMRFGRQVTGWLWHPTPQALAPENDWTIRPTPDTDDMARRRAIHEANMKE